MDAKDNAFLDDLSGGSRTGGLVRAAASVSTRPGSDRTELSFPRYRFEERPPHLAAFILGFADNPVEYQSLLVRRAAHLTRARSAADLVVIDQETEGVVLRRNVGVIAES